MVILKSLLLASVLFISSFAQAGNADAFSKRFELVKKEGKLVAIRDRSLSFKFSIKPYLKFIKETLLEEQRLMASKEDYAYELEELFADEFQEKGDLNNQNIRYLVRSMEELKKVDVDKVFNDPGFKEVVSKFEKKIGDAMIQLDPRVVAKLDDSSFFLREL